MKLRYERGALADLEEIFAYTAADNPKAAARLGTRIETVAKRIAEAHTWARQHTDRDSGDFPSATI